MAAGAPKTLPDRLRASCRTVSARARHVRIAGELIPRYAATLPDRAALGTAAEPPELDPRAREARAAFWVSLDAINFGSGWFPTLRKPAGHSGYGTVASGLRRRFERDGPWTAEALCHVTHREIADALGQEPDHELMDLFARSLQDLGRHVADEHAASFLDLAESGGGSAVALVERLAGWDCFADRSPYAELDVPFLKRAQIATADLHRAGVTRFDDLGELTMFADNLVPHVLRLDGILRFSPELVGRIESGVLLAHGSPEEVEIRACAVHAVELIAAADPERRVPAEIDEILWNRGQDRAYKARPRHRCRCTAY